MTFWKGRPRGEQSSKRGTLYYYSDGVVAIDESRSPAEFYIYATAPGEMTRVEITEQGLKVPESGGNKGLVPGGKSRIKVTATYSRPEPGRVRAIENNGQHTMSLDCDIEPQKIRDFVRDEEWNDSVRMLLDAGK